MNLQCHKTGFTLIEVLIVTTLTVVLVLAATSLLFTTLLSSGRANSSTVVKTNGDYALGQIEYLLRNAIELIPNDQGQTCQQGMSQIRFRSTDEGVTQLFSQEVNGIVKIASNSGKYLTSDEVEVRAEPVFNCVQSPDQAVTLITVSFVLGKGEEGVDRTTEIVEEKFETSVTIRNF